MRFAILSKSGIDDLVDEELGSHLLNRGFERVINAQENFDRRKEVGIDIRIVQKFKSYCIERGHNSEKVDVLGFCSDVPNFAVSSDKEEYKEFYDYIKPGAFGFGFTQDQLVVLNEGIFHRNFTINWHKQTMRIKNIQGVYFMEDIGLCNSKSKDIGIYDPVLEGMTKYFLDSKDKVYRNYKKIIFDSKISRSKIVKTLDKLGVKELI